MTRKNELAATRVAQLAKLREQTGTPEQFDLNLACAAHDRNYVAHFARFSAANPFRCDKIEEITTLKGTAAGRPSGAVRAYGGVRISVDEVETGSVFCPSCRDAGRWTLCNRCSSFVCGAQRDGAWFRCRASCGNQFTTAPLEMIDGRRSSGPAAGMLALGQAGLKFLTRK